KVRPTGDEGVRFGGVAGGVPGVAHDASLSWDSRVGRVPAGRTGVDRPSGAGYDRIRLRRPRPPGSRPRSPPVSCSRAHVASAFQDVNPLEGAVPSTDAVQTGS